LNDVDNENSQPITNLTLCFQEWDRPRKVQKENSHIWNTTSSIYYFIERNYEELEKRKAIARLGRSKRAAMLIHVRKTLEFCQECAIK